MDKSQLRRLALDYAHGRLGRDEYREKRATLLDDIVSGQTRIERETSIIDVDVTQPSAFVAVTPDRGETPDAETSAQTTLSPLHVGVGAALLLLLAAIGVWLFAGDAPAPAAPPVVTTAPAPAVSPARALVERFVAEKNFSERSLSAFRDSWSGLRAADIEDARGAPWFRRLVTIVVQEVKTQKALADLDGTGAAADTAQRLFEFGRFLEISEGLLPEVSTSAPPPAALPAPVTPVDAPVPASAAPALAITPTAVASTPATAPPAPAPTPAGAPSPSVLAPPSTPPPPNGREWLQRQPVDAYTLQLFALNHLEKVEDLITHHPELDFHLLDFSPGEPRYRVLYGSFGTSEQALAAYAALPEAVRRAQPQAFARVVGELLLDDRPGATPAALSTWLRQQPPGRFTLQLFASNNRDNAQRMMRRFPDLALALHESADDRSRYRVLYGSFSSAEEARRAFTSLPAGLAEDAGLPLVKSIGELQLSEARSTAAN